MARLNKEAKEKDPFYDPSSSGTACHLRWNALANPKYRCHKGRESKVLKLTLPKLEV